MGVSIIHNRSHYTKVIQRIKNVRRTLWIGTADIKDVHLDHNGTTVSLLAVLNQLCQKKVQIKLLFAKEPGPQYKSSLDKYPLLKSRMEVALCPRVHFKMMIMDSSFAYFGSANLTGAGIGMKTDRRRNFESGIITDEPSIIASLKIQFDAVWSGNECPPCDRKAYCKKPISRYR